MTLPDLRSPAFLRAAVILVGIDILLILLHVATFGLVVLGLLDAVPQFIRIDADWTLAEMANYAKWLAIVALLLVIGYRARLLIAFVWAVVFLEVLADDALQLHERAGGSLAASLSLQPVLGLRPMDMGELLYFAAVASLFLSMVAVAMWYGGRRAVRFSIPYLLVLAALAAVGVVMDTAHQVVVENDLRILGFNQTDALFAILEDGGEMVVASLALAMTICLAAVVSTDAHRDHLSTARN